MTTLQIPVASEINDKLGKKSKRIGLSKTAYVKVLIARDLGMFEDNDNMPGNIFNADRDNDGKGLTINELQGILNTAEK